MISGISNDAREVLQLLREDGAIAGDLVQTRILLERWGDRPDHVLAAGVIWLVESGFLDDSPSGYRLTDKGAAAVTGNTVVPMIARCAEAR